MPDSPITTRRRKAAQARRRLREALAARRLIAFDLARADDRVAELRAKVPA